MIQKAIYNAFDKKLKRNHGEKWEYPMYWAIDLHDVIIPGSYTRNNDGKCLFPNAHEVLKRLSGRKDMCLILFTSSHDDAVEEVLKWLKGYDIVFDYVNCNPECEDGELCCFQSKFYFDILLDDKAGFNGDVDWFNVAKTLVKVGQWDREENIDKT